MPTHCIFYIKLFNVYYNIGVLNKETIYTFTYLYVRRVSDAFIVQKQRSTHTIGTLLLTIMSIFVFCDHISNKQIKCICFSHNKHLKMNPFNIYVQKYSKKSGKTCCQIHISAFMETRKHTVH